ncbi:MAG: hypothetical protein OEY38_06740 [Gammaproteobacteria bacterium]|nr:hypothetical protein [Gammaproteobacteria bacterium]
MRLFSLPKLSLIVIAIMLSACSITKGIAYDVPTALFEGPETSGAFLKLNTAYSLSNGVQIKVGEVQVSEFNTSIDKTRSINSIYKSTLHLDMGLLSRLDFKSDLRMNFLSRSFHLYGLKYQIFGEPALQKNKGVKWAILLKGVTRNFSDKFSVPPNTGEISLESNIAEIASIIGHRYSPKLLAYNTLVYRHYDINTKAQATSSTDYLADASSKSLALLVGVELNGRKSNARLEAGLNRSRLTGLSKINTSFVAGFRLNRSWF